MNCNEGSSFLNRIVNLKVASQKFPERRKEFGGAGQESGQDHQVLEAAAVGSRKQDGRIQQNERRPGEFVGSHFFLTTLCRGRDSNQRL